MALEQFSVKTKPLSPPRLSGELMFILVAMLVGFSLRLIWLEDMKWTYDEIWMYEKVLAIVQGKEPLPWLGMRSSAVFLNPGFSVWSFVPLGLVAPTPIGMTMGVALLNIFAIAGFLLFAWFRLVAEEQRIWLWGLAIISVNPLAIFFSRSIWSQNLLLPFTLPIFITHRLRYRLLGAFSWGLVGALVGQLHMSGFFFQFALVLWTLWCDRRQLKQQAKTWMTFLVGSVVGLLPMIPWVQYLMSELSSGAGVSDGSKTFFPEFYLQWVMSSLGINLEYEMGPVFWSRFVPEPLVGGLPSYGVALAHGVLVLCFVYIGLRYLFSKRFRRFIHGEKGEFDNTNFYWRVGALGMGPLFSLMFLRAPIYYLNSLFPFIHIWVAYLYRHRPRFLVATVLAQLFISINLLTFIHTSNGIPDAPRYGDSFLMQEYQIPD